MVGIETIIFGSSVADRENKPFRPRIEISMPSKGVLAGNASSTPKFYYLNEKLDDASKKLGFGIDVTYKAFCHGLPKPDFLTIETAKGISDYLSKKEINIDHLNPTVSGGISIELNLDNVYYNIEVDNDRDAVFYKEGPNDIPRGWDLTYDELMQKLTTEFG